MSAASASSGPSKKAAQTHMVTHLAALAMLLDEDHIEELVLNICRDNDMVAMLYRRDALPGAVDGAFDGGELFAVLNTTLWEQGRKVLEEQLARTASINRIESSMVGASVGGAISRADTLYPDFVGGAISRADTLYPDFVGGGSATPIGGCGIDGCRVGR